MNDSTKLYQFASEYSKYPGGRLRKDGPYSGEAFREDILLPLLGNYQKVCLNLTSTFGFGSSFLDEAFGEIGKRLGIHECTKRLFFQSDDDPLLVALIWEKIKKAARN